MNLGNPGALWLLWLIPPLLALMALAARRRAAALDRFAERSLAMRLAPPEPLGRRLVRGSLLVLVVVGFVVSAAGPRWGFQWEEIERRGVDLVVALDLSRSMLAEDLPPNRLTAAKREIRDLLDLLQGDRVGLVIFAGVAHTQVPLTLDYGAFEVFLDQLDPSWVPIGGTDLGQAVRQAIKTFDVGDRAGRAVILITDGEDHGGELEAATAEAKAEGVHVFVVGLGEPEGAPVPDGAGGFIKEGGTVVLSKLDEGSLKELALGTGASYVRGVAGDLDLRQIYLEDIKATLEARQLSSSRQRRWEERYPWFLLPALLLLVLEGVLAPRGRRATVAVLALGLTVGTPDAARAGWFGDDPARAGWDAFQAGEPAKALESWIDAQVSDPHDRRLDYNIGQAHYALEAWPEAEQAFLAASATGSTDLAADALYGAGNASFQQGRYQDATGYYDRALELRPDDADTLANRDLAQRRYEELLEQAQQDEEGQPPEGEPPPEGEESEESQDGEAEESQDGESEEPQDGEAEEKKQEQQEGKGANQEPQDGEGEPEDAEAQEEPEPSEDGEPQDSEQKQQDADPSAEEKTGGEAAAADINRDGEAEETEPAQGELAQQTEADPTAQDEAQFQPVEGALSPDQAQSLLRALQADQARRRSERTEREAARGRRSAAKDW